jgi:hypothetical protein
MALYLIKRRNILIFQFFRVGEPLFVLSYQPRMIDEFGAVDGMRIGRETEIH